MKYSITCTCGEVVPVDAENEGDAVNKLVAAMDKHVGANEHPDVPKDLTEEQKVGMVKGAMKQG